jgi:hypothetical protein
MSTTALTPRDIMIRYPALDRMWLRAAFSFAQQTGAGPALCAYAALRSLADDGAAFADDALHAAARLAAARGLREAASSADHRRMRDEVRAALPLEQTPLQAWFAGPARLAGLLLDGAPEAGPVRTLAFGVNAALLVGYAPRQRWSFLVFGSPSIAVARYAPGTFGRAVVADPCDAATRTALLDAIFALGIHEADIVEFAGGDHRHPGARPQTLAAGVQLSGSAALNANGLWPLPLGAPTPPAPPTAIDLVRWRR